jgi:hypothetical protein
MRCLKSLVVLLCFVSGTAFAGVGTFWQEAGDAGNRFNPQDIFGGPYVGIMGEIGGGDEVDAFRFVLVGSSSLAAQTTCLDCFSIFGVGIGTALYTNDLTPVFITPAVENNTPPSNTKEWYFLTSGATYIIEFTYAGTDPPFTMSTFGEPIVGSAAAIPEPSTWALMIAGLAGILVMRRRRIFS